MSHSCWWVSLGGHVLSFGKFISLFVLLLLVFPEVVQGGSSLRREHVGLMADVNTNAFWGTSFCFYFSALDLVLYCFLDCGFRVCF